MIQILPVDVDEKLYFLNIWDTVSCSSLRKEKKKKSKKKSKQFLCWIYKIYTNEGCTPLLYIGQRRITILGSPDGESSDDSLVDLVSTESHSIAELPKHCF